ncbi:MAG: prepilin-type N-terminal cleavage/methylation domain-containing protein [Verrucomicrobiota bacterium]|nr:prepilin-type N-terminal cleavage/methylation domain-containing protein [Chthoniobacterales bacterium]MDQ3415012.1 prepilin-type N-terminal cleavage/methylation domain-containing protein [Verrucomicrobiota bacterium]
MSIVRADRRRAPAFTLLEVMLAVAILGMMAMAIFRFVSTNLTAVRLSTELNETDARYEGLASLLTQQLQELAPGQEALLGEPYKFSGRSRDEMTWICPAGPGLMTRYALGEYYVTLRLRPIEGSDQMELGVVREAEDESNPVPENKAWVSLMRGVQSMEIRYFDPRLNAWVERWTDRSTLPHLVRLTIAQAGASVPWEAVLALRRSPL